MREPKIILEWFFKLKNLIYLGLRGLNFSFKLLKISISFAGPQIVYIFKQKLYKINFINFERFSRKSFDLLRAHTTLEEEKIEPEH